MKEKPSPVERCPICEYDQGIEASQRTFTHATMKGVKKGKWWNYECPNCGITFTTTESDEISLKQFKK